MKIKKQINKIKYWFENFEDFLCKYSKIISLVISILCSALYLEGFFIDIRSAMTNVITLASIMFAIISLILSLYAYLEGTKIWERKNKFFSELDKSIEDILKKSLKYTILVLIIAMGISVVKPFENVTIKVIVCLAGIYLFINMLINTLYLLIVTIDFVIGSKRYEANIRKNNPVK